MLRTLLAEHALAEEGEVQSGAVGGELLQPSAQSLGCGVDHQLPGETAQRALRERDHDSGSQDAQAAADRDRELQVPVEKVGNVAAEPVELPGGGRTILGAHHPVDEADREAEARFILQQVRQPLRGRITMDARVGSLDPAAYPGDRRLRELIVGVGLCRMQNRVTLVALLRSGALVGRGAQGRRLDRDPLGHGFDLLPGVRLHRSTLGVAVVGS